MNSVLVGTTAIFFVHTTQTESMHFGKESELVRSSSDGFDGRKVWRAACASRLRGSAARLGDEAAAAVAVVSSPAWRLATAAAVVVAPARTSGVCVSHKEQTRRRGVEERRSSPAHWTARACTVQQHPWRQQRLWQQSSSRDVGPLPLPARFLPSLVVPATPTRLPPPFLP